MRRLVSLSVTRGIVGDRYWATILDGGFLPVYDATVLLIVTQDMQDGGR
jgi:hypothetical protein